MSFGYDGRVHRARPTKGTPRMNQQPIPLRTRRVGPIRRLTPAPARIGVPDPAMLRLTRPRLVELLEAAARRPLTVVNAPAGSGKTMAARDWAAEAEDSSSG